MKAIALGVAGFILGFLFRRNFRVVPETVGTIEWENAAGHFEAEVLSITHVPADEYAGA